MSPHRTAPFVGASSGAAASIVAASPAVILGILWSIVTGLSSVLFFFLLMAMGFDLVTGTQRARSRPEEGFDYDVGGRGVKKKLGRLTLVGLAFVLNGTLITLSHATGIMRGQFDGGWVVMACIGGLIYLEAVSVLENMAATDPAAVRGVGQALFGALRAIRKIDDTNHLRLYGEPAPERRHVDAALDELKGQPDAEPPAPRSLP